MAAQGDAEKRETVTAAEVIRNFGYWQQKALLNPLVVTHHGRARVMLISTEHYGALTAPALADARQGGHLEALLANSAEGFVLADANLDVLDANKLALDWLGVTLDQIEGRAAHYLCKVENLLFATMMRRVLHSGEALSYEMVSTRAGKRLKVHSYPFGNCVASVFTDITEERGFRDAADTLDAMQLGLDMLDAVATAEIDGDGRISCPSRMLERLTSLTAEALTGVKLLDLIEPGSRPAVSTVLCAAIGNRRTSRVTATLIGCSGMQRTVSLSAAPLERGLAVKGAIVAITPAANDGAPPSSNGGAM